MFYTCTGHTHVVHTVTVLYRFLFVSLGHWYHGSSLLAQVFSMGKPCLVVVAVQGALIYQLLITSITLDTVVAVLIRLAE